MVPPFKLYFYPFLLCLSQRGYVKLSDISLFIIEYFKLDDTDLSEMTKKGSNLKHISRVNYCASYLKKLNLVESKIKGVYYITPKGKIILKERGESFTRDDLRMLPEYIDMQVNKENKNMVFVDSHYNRMGKFIPSYWCDKKNLSKTTLENLYSNLNSTIADKD